MKKTFTIIIIIVSIISCEFLNLPTTTAPRGSGSDAVTKCHKIL